MTFSPRRGLPVVALLAFALIATGCGTAEKHPTNPVPSTLTQSEADEIAAQAPLALAQIGLDVEGGTGGLSSAPSLRQGAMPLRAVCGATSVPGGLEAWFSCGFYDAEGTLLEAYGPSAVRMNWRSHIWGTLVTPRDTAAIQHHSNLDFTGIQPADTAVVLNGACADTLLNRFRSADSLVTGYGFWRSTLAAANVVVRKAGGPPSSGTLTLRVKLDALRSSSTGDVIKRVDATVVVTFNGTRHPDVVVAGTYRYKWDMDHGTVTAA